MKILGLDIETAPNTVYVWRLFKYTVSPGEIIQTGRVMCWSAKWYSDEGSEIMFESEYPRRHRTMLRKVWKLLDEADVVVHYNGARFDIPTLNRDFIKAGMQPPAPYQQVDLLRVARKQFKFASNRMDHLIKELGIGEKVRHEGHSLWSGCMAGNAESWKNMEEYNRRDVEMMEALYYRLLPWISTHPNHALFKDTTRPTCPNCGEDNLQRRGFQYTKTQMYRRLQCTDCGTWSRERATAVDKEKRKHVLTQA